MTRDEVLALYDRLIAGHEGLSRKGKAMPYTSVNGNMFGFVDAEDRLCFRLSPADRPGFPDTSDVLQYGRVMKDYVAVPDALLADEAALAAWFARSVDYARGLKPKPTKR